MKLIQRISIPSSIIDLFQELGRCGRCFDDNIGCNTFNLLFKLKDYVYLVERLYKKKKTNSNDENNEEEIRLKNHILPIIEERQIAISNLNEMVSLMVLKLGCWHSYVENKLTNIRYNNSPPYYLPCNGLCPCCSGSQNELVKPILRSGLTVLLLQTMVLDTQQKYSPTQLAKKLAECPNVGKVVYNRSTSVNISRSSDTSITILQLLCTNMIYLHVDEHEKPEGYCKLSVSGFTVHCTQNKYWKYIPLYDEPHINFGY